MKNEQYQKAKFYLQVKKYEQGLKYIKALLTESPSDDMLYAFFASNYQGLRNFRKAENAISKAISLHPSEYSHFKMVSKIQLLMHKPEKVKTFLRTDIELNPLDPDLFAYQSFVYTTKHDFSKALEFADNGLKIDPTNVECLKAKALTLSFLKRDKKAKNITNSLLEDNPVNTQNLFADGLASLIDGS